MCASAARRFLEAVAGQGDAAAMSLEQRSADLRRRLLEFGSATPDNLAAAERAEVGADRQADGAARVLVGGATPVADVLDAAGDSPVPDAVRYWCPELSQEDWEAAMRIATLVFAALTERSDVTHSDATVS